MNKKWAHEDYENKLIELNIESWPIEQYIGYDIPIKHVCINDHVTSRAPGNVLNYKKCKICTGLVKRDHNRYLEDLANKNIVITPVEEYVNTDVAIKHKCSAGHEWVTAPKHVLEGRECPSCVGVTGYYCTSFFNNHPEIANKPGLLYCVVLVNKATQERTCIKIGITKGTSNKDVLKRVNHFKGYETRIQKTVSGTLEEVYYLEQYLHEKWQHKKYTSAWKFGGHSELFELDPEIIRSVPKQV